MNYKSFNIFLKVGLINQTPTRNQAPTTMEVREA
jgi:hypothetical protein